MSADDRALQDRRMLAKAIFRLFDDWKLPEADQLALLGFAVEDVDSLSSMRQAGALASSEELMERTRSLLRIYRYLAMLYPEHPHLSKKWMMSSNPRLEGEAPIERIKNGGTAGIRLVSAMLEEQLF
jgi:hypothetical protein